MRVCLDTNVLLQLFGTQRKFAPILDALVAGEVELAVSNEILLEYEETLTALSGSARWQQVDQFLRQLSALRGNVLFVEPHYRFAVVTGETPFPPLSLHRRSATWWSESLREPVLRFGENVAVVLV